MKDYDAIRKILEKSESTVFFGGAGVSTESGIPDFRGNGGLYKNPSPKLSDPPEYLLSIDCLRDEPEKFFDYYRNNMLYPDARPNNAHKTLAKMERDGKLKSVVTQNIDGLHQKAGSKKVYELHGTTARYYCMDCGKTYGADLLKSVTGVPRCSCRGVVRPEVVLYGEGLPTDVFSEAGADIYCAETLIVGGTSLTVHPAASLISLFRGKHLIMINLSPTPYDGLAEYIVREPIAKVLPEIYG